MEKILVTGGLGFIGSNFIKYMFRKYKDVEIFNYDKVTYAANPDNLKEFEGKKEYHFIKGDINNFEFLDYVVNKNKIGTIIHFAAESHVDNSIKNPNVFVETNVLGTMSILNIVKRHNLRFHHISTDEVFGSLGFFDKPFDETSCYDPKSPYSASKAASDHLVRSYINTFGIKATISNCGNNYGPLQHEEKLIPKSITNILKGENILIYGKGENIRDWIHVQDHCRAIDLILHKGKIGETYCISGRNEKSNIEIARMIVRLMKVSQNRIEFIKDRPGHDLRYAINDSKLRSLGFEPEYDFETGLKETIEYYKKKHQGDNK
ncbi:MAG: dTDP-glucose 4,6-dehydratase [Candidatus Woesearchaeota archaeon]|nr:dTDP-glucose 4,6-dehydratase [Candidatus Woesearchaeota archaeon]